jgi:hypothetical protein
MEQLLVLNENQNATSNKKTQIENSCEIKLQQKITQLLHLHMHNLQLL